MSTKRKERLIFMGSPHFSVPALQVLIDSPYEVVAVYTQPPKPKDRGHQVKNTPVHDLALAHGIEVFTPKTLRDADEQERFRALNADLAIVAAYGLILPRPILTGPRLGCVNIHASLLPRWRGAAPIHRAIMAMDRKTGITLMQMDIGLDTGDMLAIEEVAINEEMTTPQLHDLLSAAGARLLQNSLDGLMEGALFPKAQDEDFVTYAHKIEKAEGQLMWDRLSAQQLAANIRALKPWPGTYFHVNDDVIKVHEAKTIETPTQALQENWDAGTFFSTPNGCLNVMCYNQTALQLLTLQRAGGKPMPCAEFLKGYPALKPALTTQ